MMQPDEKKQRLVKMTLRIVVAAYIGFMGVMLVKGYLGDPNIAFLIFGILFLVLAVGFVVYALVSYFKAPAGDGVSSEASPTADGVPDDDSSSEEDKQVSLTGAEEQDSGEKRKISDFAKYKSDD
ncbi:MAG: phage holin family protein [Eubacterium sp.]|nr:phage holin family protein [Eubacterium sp.]